MTGPASLECNGPVATLCFNRPAKRNALDLATWLNVPLLIAAATGRIETRVIIVRGAGGNFAAGADISEFDMVFADRSATLDYLAAMSGATAAIEAAPVPVIALIEGMCIGAGVAVALACDVRLAAADARFALTPAKLGLMLSLADTRRVIDAVGASAAKDLLFTGRMIDAATAMRIGLCDEVHAPEALADAVAAKSALIVANSPWTHAHSKAVVRRILGGGYDDDDETRGLFADAPEGDDYREGLAAFRARRTPVFPHR